MRGNIRRKAIRVRAVGNVALEQSSSGKLKTRDGLHGKLVAWPPSLHNRAFGRKRAEPSGHWRSAASADSVRAMTGADEIRLARLIAAEERALDMLAAIEAAGFIQPGRRESEVDADIAALAEHDFGVTRHWHKRLVRAGANTLCVFADNPEERTIGANDTVYLDLGPVFEAWEADIGQTYAIGNDPAHHALVAALPKVFEDTRAHANADPDISGAELYARACAAAEQRGYVFGGKIAGHTVGEFPHLTWPGEREHTRIYPDNPNKLSDPDHLGRKRFWIIETHLIAPDCSFGGFYERLLRS